MANKSFYTAAKTADLFFEKRPRGAWNSDSLSQKSSYFVLGY